MARVAKNLSNRSILLVLITSVLSSCSYIRVESQDGLIDPSPKKYSSRSFENQKIVLKCTVQKLPEKVSDGLCDHVDELLTMHGAEVFQSREALEQTTSASRKADALPPIFLELNSKLQSKQESTYINRVLLYLTYGFWPIEDRKAYKITLHASGLNQPLSNNKDIKFAVRKITGFGPYLGQTFVNWLYRDEQNQVSTEAASSRLTFWLDKQILNTVYNNRYAFRLRQQAREVR